MSLIGGAAAGALAAMAMTGVRQATTGLGLVRRTPPEAAAQTAMPELLRGLDSGQRQAVIEFAHWAYGAGGGAVYALLPETIRRNTLVGLGYGAGTWVVYDRLVAPLVGQKREGGAAQDLSLLADHLMYGAILARVLR
jgi:hypothetical protein